MTSHIFTYGSLMFPQVWQRVVRGSYRAVSAALEGYARFEIRNETYPGMIAKSGAIVPGVLYLDVDAQDIAALDAFEGIEYRRETVHVKLETGERAEAAAYIYLLPQHLSDAPWLPENFQMERFIGSYCRDKLGDC